MRTLEPQKREGTYRSLGTKIGGVGGLPWIDFADMICPRLRMTLWFDPMPLMRLNRSMVTALRRDERLSCEV